MAAGPGVLVTFLPQIDSQTTRLDEPGVPGGTTLHVVVEASHLYTLAAVGDGVVGLMRRVVAVVSPTHGSGVGFRRTGSGRRGFGAGSAGGTNRGVGFGGWAKSNAASSNASPWGSGRFSTRKGHQAPPRAP